MGTEFSERFTKIRQESGYTQQKLAEKLGVTAQAVSKWETGASLPDVEMLKSIAIFLNCSIDSLLGHETTPAGRISLEAMEQKNEIERAMQKEILELRVGTGLVDMLLEEQKQKFQSIHNLRMRIAKNYGVLVPTIRLMDDPALKEKEYQILLYGKTPLANGSVEYPMLFYFNQQAKEDKGEIAAKEPVWQVQGAWKMASTADAADMDGTDICGKDKKKAEFVTAMEIIICHMEQVIIKHYNSILNRQMTAEMVELVHQKYPVITEGVVPQKVSYALLQKVIAGTIKRGYGIISLAFLIELVEDAVTDKDGEKTSLEAFADSICDSFVEQYKKNHNFWIIPAPFAPN